jgi:hypothetical protein
MGGCSRMDDIELTIRAAGRPSEWNGLALLPFPERERPTCAFSVWVPLSLAILFVFFSPMHAHAGVYVNIIYTWCVVCISARRGHAI